MPKALIGKKLGMTQIFNEKGKVIPLTLVEVGPCFVLQVKTEEKDGYAALQIGFGQKKQANKPMTGHLKNSGSNPARIIREVDVSDDHEYKPGDVLNVGLFSGGDKIDVVGTSKGRGFQGVVRRYGFRGGKKTHGSMFHRSPGSIGASAYPSRVFKGRKLPGRMGGKRVTVQNLEVVTVDEKQNLLGIRGAIPGPSGGYVIIRKR